MKGNEEILYKTHLYSYLDKIIFKAITDSKETLVLDENKILVS